jgi:hypothetical protein
MKKNRIDIRKEIFPNLIYDIIEKKIYNRRYQRELNNNSLIQDFELKIWDFLQFC